VETLNHLQMLTGYGVNYRSFTEQYLDSTGMFKEAVIGILAAVAKQERVRLSERTIAGLQRARAQGRVGGRPRTEHDPRKMTNLETLRRSRSGVSPVPWILVRPPWRVCSRSRRRYGYLRQTLGAGISLPPRESTSACLSGRRSSPPSREQPRAAIRVNPPSVTI
jgi:hypothetical protein